MNNWIYAENGYKNIPKEVFNKLERIIYNGYEIILNGCWEVARRKLK